MTQNVDMIGNTLLVDGVTINGTAVNAALDAGDILVGATVTSAGENISIAADDTLVEALQAIADIADPAQGG